MSNAHLIHSIGYIGLFAILFAETGLLVGFFLPGDTLLVSAGLLAARGQLNIGVLLAVLIAGAVLGDATGYWIGHQAGKRLFQRENSFWFRRDALGEGGTVLRTARRQDHLYCAVFFRPAHVCPDRGRSCPDDVPALCAFQHHGRDILDHRSSRCWATSSATP